MSTEAVTLPANYLLCGLGAKRRHRRCREPNAGWVLDRHGKTLHKVLLENVAPPGLALHPTKPICYVGLDRSVPPFRGAFVVVDEQAAKVTAGDEDLGQDVIVDPSGRFLVSTYMHRVARRRPDRRHPLACDAVPGRFRGRLAFGRSVRHRPRRRRGAPPFRSRRRDVGLRLGLPLAAGIPRASIRSPSTPGPDEDFLRRPSTDDAPAENRLAKFSACDPLDFKATAIGLRVRIRRGHGQPCGSDVAFHPTCPSTPSSVPEQPPLFDAESGKPISTKEKLDLPELANLSVRRALFSSDGKHLMILAERQRRRADVAACGPASHVGRADGSEKTGRLAASRVSSRPHLPWRSSRPGAEDYPSRDVGSDRGRLLRFGRDRPHGEFDGDRVLCRNVGPRAHVPPIASLPWTRCKVIYHPRESPTRRTTTEATIVYRDRKIDLALLKINVKTAAPLRRAGRPDRRQERRRRHDYRQSRTGNRRPRQHSDDGHHQQRQANDCRQSVHPVRPRPSIRDRAADRCSIAAVT